MIASCKRDKPDLVLMDVVLPGMNGFQATRALSRDAETSHIPVLIVSTKNLETDLASGACARVPRTTSSSPRARAT